MNNFIVPYEKSPYNESEVYIEVLDAGSNEVLELIQENDRNVIRLERGTGPKSFSFRLKFVVDTDELENYQFVMDAKVIPEVEGADDYYYNDDEDENVDPQITASFVAFRRSGCEGQRGFGVRKEGIHEGKGLELEIMIPSSMEISGEKEYGVNVVAAWATGRVVTLTKPVFFEIYETDGSESAHNQIQIPTHQDKEL